MKHIPTDIPKHTFVHLGPNYICIKEGDMFVCNEKSQVFNIWPVECNAPMRPIGQFADAFFGVKIKSIK